MQPMITGSPLADVMIAAGTALAAILGAILMRARNEPPKPGTPDAVVAALAANTAATEKLVALMAALNGSFGENLTHFKAVVNMFHEMLTETRAIREAAQSSKEHLNFIRER